MNSLPSWFPGFLLKFLRDLGSLLFDPHETGRRHWKISRAKSKPRINHTRMKSAYELAMERLAKSDPSSNVPLTAEQKGRLAEIDRIYKGKLAEREIFLKKQLDEAFEAQKLEDVEKIKQQISSERARIEEEREAEKDKIRRGQ